MEKTKNVWVDLHNNDESWRKKIVGDISEVFVVPRYVKLFYSYFEKASQLEFLEIGSGTADISRQIISQNKGQIKRYVLSEHFQEGVDWLKNKGFEAYQVNALDIPFPNQSFDVVVEFDVMHHVSDPRKMAFEMMRVGRGKLLMVESNGLSVFRKLMELTPGHRAAGEKSFTPQQWKSFFENHQGFLLTKFEIFPFLFPFRVPRFLLSTLVKFNHLIEKIPFFRWQCSSVAIYIEYNSNK